MLMASAMVIAPSVIRVRRGTSMEKFEMWRRIWAEMKIWAAAMEGINDPQGELLAHLERRIQALEERSERLQLAQKD